MNLQSKYDIGDIVYSPSYESTHEVEQCPDCLGGKRWNVTNPAGEQVIIDCPTCSDGWASTGTVKRFAVIPGVLTLTIGRVAYESDYGNEPHMTFKYMCRETGIGSGSVYNEADLYDSRDAALEAAKGKAAEVKADIDARNATDKARRVKQAARGAKCPHCLGSGRREKSA